MERLTPGRLSVTSESAGNTQADPESARLAMSAPGSEGILPLSPTSDNVVNTAGGATEDYARFKTDGGGTGTRPASEGGGWTTEFQDSPPWRQT